MKCAWCNAESAHLRSDIGVNHWMPACRQCAVHSSTLLRDVDRLFPWGRSGVSAQYAREVGALRHELQTRDETTGERIDWALPVDGWLLFDAPA